MQFECDLDLLTGAAGWAHTAITTRNVQPILTGMQITAGDGQLVVSGFDYEVCARSAISAAVTEPGTVVVPGKFFADIAKALPSGQAVFGHLEGELLRIRGGKSNFAVPIMPASDYPDLPAMPAVLGTAVGEEFAEAVKATARAASSDDTLPAITGVHFEIDGGQLIMVATDRYRVVKSTCPVVLADDTAETIPFLIPAATVAGFAKAAAGEGKVTVAFNNDRHAPRVGLSDGVRELIVRCLTVEYPKSAKFFEGTDVRTAIVNAERLAEAVKRCALVAEGPAPVELTFTADTLTVSATRSGGAAAEETIEGIRFAGDDGFSIKFGPRYLTDGLIGARSRTVSLSTRTPMRAVIAGCPDDTEPGAQSYEGAPYLYCVVPVR